MNDTAVLYFNTAVAGFFYTWLSMFPCSIGLSYCAASFLAQSGISCIGSLVDADWSWARFNFIDEDSGTWRLSEHWDCLPLYGSESGLFTMSLTSSQSWTEIATGT